MLIGYASIGFAILFIVILILLHFLEPEFDPSWRMISEYEIGRFGWLMRIAFFCWGASVISLIILIWAPLGAQGGMIGRGWFLLIGVALFGAGIFKTNAITDSTPGLTNTLHALCGAIVILTFPIAATLVVSSLLRSHSWLPGQGLLIFATVFAWVGLIAYFSSIIVSRILDPSAGRVGPKVYQGWPNRFLAVTYILWLIIVAGNALRFL